MKSLFLRTPFGILALLTSLFSNTPAFAKDHPSWKTETDFRNAAPMVHRQALWLETNPDAETWSDSLKTVLTWGHDVPYVSLSTAKVFEKEVQNLPKDPVAGRISSMLQVGYALFATEPDFRKATEFELAKAGVTCMIRYYENVKKVKPEYSIASMEKLSGLMHSESLDEYIQAKLRK
ncbi:MAG: hypothetical protein ABI036_04785 [Fibrobacteria bacterium]